MPSVGDGDDQPRSFGRPQAGSRSRHFLGRLDQQEVPAPCGGRMDPARACRTRNCRREGSRRLMEGMASGVASVGSRISGIPELIEDGESGLLVEPRDAKGLADALERLLRDPELRRRLATAGRAKVEREFDLRKSAASLSQRFASRVQ